MLINEALGLPELQCSFLDLYQFCQILPTGFPPQGMATIISCRCDYLTPNVFIDPIVQSGGIRHSDKPEYDDSHYCGMIAKSSVCTPLDLQTSNRLSDDDSARQV